MPPKPLQNVKIVITRAKGQAGEFAAILENAGAEVIYFPTIEFKEPDDTSIIDNAIANLKSYDWVIFTSANGVEFFFKRVPGFQGSRVQVKDNPLTPFFKGEFKSTKVGVVGPKTAQALEKLGVAIDLVPKDYRAEGLVESLVKTGITGKKILIPRALIGREVLPDMLQGSGAEVTVAPVYETIIPSGMDISNLMKAFKSGSKVVLTFTSGSTVKNFFSIFDKEQIASFIDKVTIAVISPVTADVVKELGYKVDIVPTVYTAKDLAEKIIKHGSK